MKRSMRYLAGACALLGVGTSHAVTILFNDFSGTAGLTLNGNAAQAGNVLRVTPELTNQSGSAFSTTAVPLTNQNSFSTYFQFRISRPTQNLFGDGDGPGADGLVFVVQTVSNSVGGLGGGIGYLGIANSVGVEFDTYDNGLALNDPNGNHVGIDLGGSFGPAPAAVVAQRLNDGQVWNAWIDYNGLTDALEVRLSEAAVRPSAALVSQVVDLETTLGSANAFVGFTSGTGAGVGNHDILRWEFRDTFSPIVQQVPEPGVLLLFGIGLFGWAAGGRRRA